MKPILCGFLDQEEHASFQEVIDRALRLGIDHIGLRSYGGKPLIELSDAEIKNLQNDLKTAKLKVSVIDPKIASYDVYDEGKHKEALDQFKYMLKFADRFKASHLFLRIPKFNDVIEEFDAIEKRMTDYIDQAMRAGKKIILLPVNQYKANVFAFIFKKMKSNQVSYAYNPVAIMEHGEPATTAYRLLKDKIGLIQAIDATHDGEPMLLGYGKTDVLNIFKKLLRDRYDGLIMVDNYFYTDVFMEKTEKKGFFKKIFSNDKKKKASQKSDLSRKIFPNEETKNVTYDDILENQIKVLKIIFK